MQVIVSVGLNVGDTEPAHQRRATLAILECLGPVLMHRTHDSVWQGVPERTVHAVVDVPDGEDEFGLSSFLCAMARVLGQECVASVRASRVSQPGAGWILFYSDGHMALGDSLAVFPAFPPQ